MKITLSPELQQFVDEKVRDGYGSPEAVVADAIRIWQRTERGVELNGEDLARLVAVGQADADRGDLVDGPAVFREIKAISARRRGDAG